MEKLQAGLVYNSTDKYRLNTIFGQQERMTKQFLPYIELRTILQKKRKELFCDVEAFLIACTTKWLEEEEEENEMVEEGKR